MMKKRLLVLSVDSLVNEDLETLRKAPHIGPFLTDCCRVESIRTIYPSITYPVHVSIQTGCYPDRHGVFTNNIFTPDTEHIEWTWDSRLIKADNIFAAAKRGDYSTGATFWPVTAYNPHIDYHMPEYWLPYPSDTFRESFMKMGSSEQVMQIMERNVSCLPKTYKMTGKENFTVEPQFDNFLFYVTSDIIRTYRPEVLFVHSSIIDTYRHQNGIFCPKVTEGLALIDQWFGMLQDALNAAGVLEQTNIVILSDHGQMDAVRIVKPNVYLADRGFIKMNSDGTIQDYTALGISNGMSMMFWLKEPSDRNAHDAVYKELCGLANEGIYGFNRVFTREEIAESEHLDGDFVFIIESDGYTSFSDSCTRPVVSNLDLRDYRMGRAAHGYLPDRGPQPVFLAKGPDFQERICIPRCPIVDVGPTFAKLLGITLNDAQGIPMTELLR